MVYPCDFFQQDQRITDEPLFISKARARAKKCRERLDRYEEKLVSAVNQAAKNKKQVLRPLEALLISNFVPRVIESAEKFIKSV